MRECFWVNLVNEMSLIWMMGIQSRHSLFDASEPGNTVRLPSLPLVLPHVGFYDLQRKSFSPSLCILLPLTPA